MANVVEITVRTTSDPAGLAAAEAASKASADRQKSTWESLGSSITSSMGNAFKGLSALSAGSGLLAIASPIGAATAAIGTFGAVAFGEITKVTTAQKANTAAQQTYNNSLEAAKATYATQMADAEKQLAQATTAQQRQAALNKEHQAALALSQAEAKADDTKSQSTTKLTSAEQQLGSAVSELQKLWDNFETAMAPVVLSVTELAVKLTGDLLPSLGPLATAGAKIIDSFLKPFDAFARSASFDSLIASFVKFGEQAAALAGPFMTQLIQLLMQLFVQLMPAGVQILGVLLPLIVTMVTDLTPLVVAIANVIAVSVTWLDKTNLLIPALIATGAAITVAGGPISALVVAIALIATGFEEAWKASATFRDIIKDIATVFLDVGLVIVEENQAIVNAFLTMVGAVIDGAAKAFGWVPGLGSKLKEAAGYFDGFRTSVNAGFDSVISKMNDWKAGLSGAVSTAHDLITKMTADFAGQEKAATTAKTALDSYTTSIKDDGVESTAAQKARQQLTADLEKAGVDATTAKTDVAFYTDAVKANGVESTAAQAARQRLISDIFSASNNAKAGQADLAAFTAAVKDNGAQSNAAQSARAKLLADLIAAGVDSKTAQGLVDQLTSAIKNLPNKNVNISMTGTGQFSISQVNQLVGNTAPGVQKAAGGLITGGVQGRDSVLVAAMPGEVVVPTAMVNAGEVDHLRGRLPGFASGGVIGGNLSGPYVTGMYSTFQNRMTDAMTSAMKAALSAAETAAAKAAAAATAAGSPGPGGGAPAANAALARKLYPAWGSGAEWAAWNNVAMRESGWNQFARNPSSGAYGIPQALPPSKMGAAANPPESNPTAQINWMIGYIKGRYGDPIGAWNHELSAGWYDNGGWLKPGLTMAYNGTGQPEQVVAPGQAGGAVQLQISPAGASAFEQFMVMAIREWVRVRGGGDVQTAFGRN